MIILVLRLTETSNFCEKATTTTNCGDMASIDETTTIRTRSNEYFEKAAEGNELKINKNDYESGESNEGSPTGEKNEDGEKTI